MSNKKGTISKNWAGVGTTGIVDFSIRITGEVNAGTLMVMPSLSKMLPQGIADNEILLELRNTSDATPEQFRIVEFLENMSKHYENALIMIAGKLHESVPIKWIH